jgi:hypothetical protein
MDAAMETGVGAVADDLVDFGPNWCLFWGRGVTGFHLDIWMPYLRRSRHRYLIMSGQDRFSDTVREQVADLPNCRILEPYAGAKERLRACSGFRGFLYIGTKEENFRVVNSFGGKSHVWLGHGESDKVYNAFRTASLYDSMFVARYGIVDRYPRAIRRWVKAGACAIGTPIVEGAIKDPWPEPRPIRTILYAPTWEGGNERSDYTSLDAVGPQLIEHLPELAERGVSVIMRPHPSTGARRPELRDLRDAIYAAGARPGADKAADFAEADVMLSDISGVTAEFLYPEKPGVMPVSEHRTSIGKGDDRHVAEYPWVYPWHVERESVPSWIDRLQATDPLRSARAGAAKSMFRGHRSLADAARSFDLALESVRWRKTRIPPRYAYELKRWLPDWVRVPRAIRSSLRRRRSPARR